MFVNLQNYSFNFSFLEKAAQDSQKWALNQLDRIYPINPYTHQRELCVIPDWLFRRTAIDKDNELIEWPKDKKVAWHTWQRQGSDQHFRSEALTSYPALEAYRKQQVKMIDQLKLVNKQDSYINIFKYLLGITNPLSQELAKQKQEEATLKKMWDEYKQLSTQWDQSCHQNDHVTFHTVAHSVFDRIRKYVDQVALESGASRYQLDYQFKILEDSQINAYTIRGGKIYFYSLYLEAMDGFSVKGYEFLSLEEKIASVVAHEFAHNCLGHTQSNFNLVIFFILGTFSIGCSLCLLATDLSALFKTYAPLFPLQTTSEALKFVYRLYWALKGAVILPLGIIGVCKLDEAFIEPYIFSFIQRQEERDADAYAVELLYQSGFDIRSAQYIEALSLHCDELNKKEDSYWWSTSTHPSTAERLKNVTEIVESYHKKYGHYKKP
ncbi:MAG: M48 family metalloprotease [Bdellovibrionales bacterium]|nr:M48 family metalloprotease [Bdellovibrionales bacterium]